VTGVFVDVVVPSAGRTSLRMLLAALAGGQETFPGRIIVVDDRRARGRLGGGKDSGPRTSWIGDASGFGDRVEVLRGRGAGPAAARNVGWRAASASWVAFLDDDVVPDPDWAARLADDLRGAAPEVAGVQGRVRVPLPEGRRPTDWERNVAGLEGARWATADMAYRRDVLAVVGGFDERFPRAYREDADLGLRVRAAGWSIATGERRVTHPVRSAGPLISVRLQAGNADDVLMGVLHGPGWREAAGAPPGRARRHAAVCAGAAAALAGAGTGRRWLLAAGAAGWGAGTAELALARILPGPRSAREVGVMVATSVLLPPVASYHRLRGLVRRRSLLGDTARAPRAAGAPRPPEPAQAPGAPRPEARDVLRLTDAHHPGVPEAVLLDRDGTLIVDVPYNGDPERVVALPGARAALERLREAGVPTGVVSNQSGVGRGFVSPAGVAAVNARVEELLGPLGPWAVCPHAPDAGCACRKPAPGLVLEAAGRLGVAPSRCAVVGDIGADVEAARAAGARGVLVPTRATRREEIAAAPEVACDLGAAVELLLAGAAPAWEAPVATASPAAVPGPAPPRALAASSGGRA
jgi:HAD superfamily hydrolase (TIGR01662 family)